jgi:hypothetical protein
MSNNGRILLKRLRTGALTNGSQHRELTLCASRCGCQKTDRIPSIRSRGTYDASNFDPCCVCSLADLASAERGFGRRRKRIGRPVCTRTRSLQLPQHHLHLWRSPLFQFEPVLLSRVLPISTAAGASDLAAPTSMFGSLFTVLNRKIDRLLGWQCRSV